MVKSLKLLLLAMAMLAGGSANAQQLPNANFDGDWVGCYPWEKGAKVKNARGTQPDGWCMANVNGMGGLGATIVGAQGADRSEEDGKKSVTITNTPNPLSAQQVVPGYMSLGTTWATAKATMSGVVTAGTADGGVFGGLALTTRPDALRFYYKRGHNVNKTTKSPTNLAEKASIIAYAWKGTWTQVEVPSNTSMTNPTKVTMTDRSNNILGKDCLLGGAITKTDDAELISQIEYYIEGDQADWKQVTIPFEYKNETAIPEKFNVIFSANDIFADRAGIGAGNQLCIDDVELVYYHSLTALSYDGKAIEGFAEDNYEYSLDEEYDASKELTYTKTGIASTVSTNYDEEAALLSICVKGDDGEETVYTIQFAQKAQVYMTITNAQYATFCAPMEVELPQGVKAYSCSQVGNNNELALEQVSGSIPANTPVILWSESEYSNVCKGTVESVEEYPTSGLLTGVYEPTPAPVGSYVLQQKADNVAFYKVTSSDIMVGANRAYLSVPSCNAKAFTLNPESATSINALNSLMNGKAEIYDLNGRKRSTLHKGINIVNGTKVIVK